MQKPGQDDQLAARVLQRVVTAACATAMVALAALVLVTVVDVAGRFLFNKPLFGGVEISEFLLLFIGFGGMAYAERNQAHITVDFFVTALPQRARTSLDWVAALLGTAFWTIVAWRAIEHAQQIREAAEVSLNLAIPTYPFYIVVAAGSGLFALLLAGRVFGARRSRSG